MSFDLVFWVDPVPTDDEEAAEICAELLSEAEELDDPVGPRIGELCAALADRVGGPESGWWAVWPLESEGVDEFLVVKLVPDVPDRVVLDIASQAHRLDVVCFDPQSETLL